MSVAALRELTHDEDVIAIVGTAGTTDLGAIDPLDAIADRAEELGAWFHVDAAVGSGLTLSDTHRPPARRHRAGELDHGGPAQAVVDAVRRERAAGPGRRRRCARSTTRASISTGPRTRPRGSSTWSGARWTRRVASTPSRCSWRCARAAAGNSGRWSTRCSTSRSTPGEAIQARPELELVAPPHTVMVAFRRVGDDARNVEIHRAPVRERRGGDRPHDRRRARRAQAHAAEPEHDARADRRAAGPDQRSVSLTARSRPSTPTAVPLTRAPRDLAPRRELAALEHELDLAARGRAGPESRGAVDDPPAGELHADPQLDDALAVARSRGP